MDINIVNNRYTDKYILSFYNNYLLREIIKMLENVEFIPVID